MKHKIRLVGLAAVGLIVLATALTLGGNSGSDDPNGTRESALAGAGADGSVNTVAGQSVAPSKGDIPLPGLPPAETEARAAAAPATQPDLSNGGAFLGATSDRKIIQTASISMQAENVGRSFDEIGRIAATAGGFVANSNFYYESFINRDGEEEQRQLGSMTIRVPSTRLQDVLSQVRALGVKIDAESSDSNDVTEEYTDLGARLRTLEATQVQLLDLLGKATTIGDILQVQDRLNGVLYEIEQVKGRMQLLDNLTDLATLTVSLQPVVDDTAIQVRTQSDRVDLGEKISQAWDDSIEFLSKVAGNVLTVVVFSWWLLPLAVPAIFIYSRLNRGQRSTPTQAP